MSAAAPLLEVDGLTVDYGRGAGRLRAVDNISFSLPTGSTLAIIGESGSGKSSVLNVLAGLVQPSGGTLTWPSSGGTRPSTQVIFQDPTAALNRRLRVWQCVAEPMRPRSLRLSPDLRPRAIELLQRVGLTAEQADRRPSALSGGQRQRVTIARALAAASHLVLCDEPVAALDVTLRASVLDLLTELRAEYDLTYVYVSHELTSVRRIADHVAVMYMGQIIELGATEAVLGAPKHPYTQALLAAQPRIEIERRSALTSVRGEAPDPRHPPSGCRFHTRCPLADEWCASSEPTLERGRAHAAACHHQDEAARTWEVRSGRTGVG